MKKDDRLYFVTGEISNNLIGNMFGVFFNKELVQDYQTDDLYTLVEEGKWTLDTMFGIAENVYQDLNNDGKKDPGDFYGLFSNNTSFDNLYYAAGMSVIKPDASGTMVISPDFSGEKMVSLLEKLCRAFHESDGCSFGTEENAYAVTAFMEERALFLPPCAISCCPPFLSTSGEFILPAHWTGSRDFCGGWYRIMTPTGAAHMHPKKKYCKTNWQLCWKN